ncbi:MAG TPA: serpin family protein [Pseudonocardiaceae bacterium]|nr:serpin family protein [Pseudonocardiaceae bacterium]
MPTTTLGQQVEHTHLAFTLAVQRALAGSADTTSCWSPYSVASALGLAATGARGATRDELVTLLMGDSGADLAAHGAMLLEGASIAENHPRNPPELDVANTMWHDRHVRIRPEFAHELAAWPNGATRDAPFGTDPDGARRMINADVAETTRGLIPGLLGPGSIKPDTGATLVNALYLKAAWNEKFPENATAPMPFHGPAHTSDVPAMRLRKRIAYAATGGWQIVTLPAAGDLHGIILLPDNDLAAAESTLDAGTLADLLAAPAPRLLDLHLPRFRARAKAKLGSALRGLGVRTMFSDDADFAGVSDTPLAVDSVEHEAVLTIDERGLEGAAATAVTMRVLAMHRDLSQPIEVKVDRPFLFLVRHRLSGAVYFLARVVAP